jgi:hypothetical protein
VREEGNFLLPLFSDSFVVRSIEMENRRAHSFSYILAQLLHGNEAQGRED